MSRAKTGRAVTHIEAPRNNIASTAEVRAGKKLGVVEEDPSQTGAEQEGRQHPGERDGHRTAEVAPDDVDPELHADDEHVQGQTELGHRKQVALRVARELRPIPREEPGLKSGASQPSSDGPRSTPATISATTWGCPNRAPDQPHQPARHEDGRQLQEELQCELDVGHRFRAHIALVPSARTPGRTNAGVRSSARTTNGDVSVRPASGLLPGYYLKRVTSRAMPASPSAPRWPWPPVAFRRAFAHTRASAR